MSEKDISDGYAKFKFWVALLASVFLGLAYTWLLEYLFLEVKKDPIVFIVMLAIIPGCFLGYIGYRGLDFQRKFGYYPWRKKPDDDDEWTG